MRTSRKYFTRWPDWRRFWSFSKTVIRFVVLAINTTQVTGTIRVALSVNVSRGRDILTPPSNANGRMAKDAVCLGPWTTTETTTP